MQSSSPTHTEGTRKGKVLGQRKELEKSCAFCSNWRETHPGDATMHCKKETSIIIKVKT